MRVVHIASLFILIGISFTITIPFAFAQEGDLEATIRAVILSDPRSAEMTEVEVNAMVAALASAASEQGMSPEDIVWRPQDDSTFSGVEEGGGEACGYPVFLCSLNEAFGFSGDSLVIPLVLGVCSALLLFVLGSILLHVHGHHPVRGPISPSL